MYRSVLERQFKFSDTSDSPHGDLGIIAVVPVGMAHLAWVTLTAVVGAQVTKGTMGEEFGFFQFGGSDIIVLFLDRRDHGHQ